MQMHVGAVEQRIALADDGDHAAGVEMGGHFARGRVIERADDVAIGCFFLWHFGRHRDTVSGSSRIPGRR